jgi:hypothetical protein
VVFLYCTILTLAQEKSFDQFVEQGGGYAEEAQPRGVRLRVSNS